MVNHADQGGKQAAQGGRLKISGWVAYPHVFQHMQAAQIQLGLCPLPLHHTAQQLLQIHYFSTLLPLFSSGCSSDGPLFLLQIQS
jgi:hypothetical protein